MVDFRALHIDQAATIEAIRHLLRSLWIEAYGFHVTKLDCINAEMLENFWSSVVLFSIQGEVSFPSYLTLSQI